VEKTGMMTKLGFKKGPFGSESWQKRLFTLVGDTLCYSEGQGKETIKAIKLTSACQVMIPFDIRNYDFFFKTATLRFP
jgi:hypothetical protein